MTDRTLSKCQHKFASSNCKACGIYNHPKDPAIKTVLYDSYLNCSGQKYLKHMRRRQCQLIQSKELHEQTYSFLLSICEKFEYQIETLALGIYFYAKTYAREEKQLGYEKFWASASLIVASKAIELDRKVPYLNRYQRYAERSYNQSQYQIAERKIFELLNHDVQKTTFISYLNFYLTNGIVFESDGLFQGSLKYLEDDVMEKANDYIKNGEFLKFEPEKLALKIIKEVRGKYRLVEWATGIGKVSGHKQEQIEEIDHERQILKPICNIKVKKSDRLATSISINLQCLSSTNLMQQKFKLCKKRNKSFTKIVEPLSLKKIQSMKENSQKDRERQNSVCKQFRNVLTSAPLAMLRNQLTNNCVMNVNGNFNNFSKNSSMNRINGCCLGGGVDGIIPLNTFAKRA